MANYSITINSKFRPFSFQELMTPLMMMEQNHREVEDQYANLMTESAKWENLANEQTDKIAYNQYKRYALDLELAADKLAKEGITANSRPSMYKLKSRYNSEIAPIELAYKRREADANMQKEMMLKDPTHLFNRRAGQISLDDYLTNNSLDVLSDNYSGALLTKQVSDQVKALADRISAYGPGKDLDPYTKTFLVKYGLDPDEVRKAKENPNSSEGAKFISAVIDNVMFASGITKWDDPKTIEKALGYAWEGAASAIGKSGITTFENFENKKALEYSYAERLENLKHAHAKELYSMTTSDPLNPNIPISTNPLISAVDMEELQEASEFTKFFKKDKNGKFVGLTPEGVREYNKKSTMMNGQQVHNSKLFDYITKINGEKYKNGADAINGAEIAKLFDKKMASLGAASGKTGQAYYDAYAIKATQRSFPQGKDYQDGLKSAIISATFVEGGKINEVKWDNKRNQYVRTGKHLDSDELMKDEVKILGSERSARGLVYKVLEDGEPKIYEIPKELNTTNYDNAQGAYKRAEFYQRLVGGHAGNIKFDWYAPSFGEQGSSEYNAARELLRRAINNNLSDEDLINISTNYSNAFINAETNADNLHYITDVEDYKPKPH